MELNLEFDLGQTVFYLHPTRPLSDTQHSYSLCDGMIKQIDVTLVNRSVTTLYTVGYFDLKLSGDDLWHSKEELINFVKEVSDYLLSRGIYTHNPIHYVYTNKKRSLAILKSEYERDPDDY